MIINLSGINLYLEEYRKNDNSPAILLLHGFTGSSQDWKSVVDLIDPSYQIFALDFVGHGKSDSPFEVFYYETDFIISSIKAALAVIKSNKKIILGYSMGGRAALSFTANNTNFIDGLILESSTAGISNELERKNRYENDLNLAEFITQKTIDNFVDYWMNIDLFRTQKKLNNDLINSVRNSKLKNNITGLANSLRGFSTGKMPNLTNKISSISCKSLLVTGELDEKFTNLNIILNSSLTNSEHHIIKNAGHNTHLENSIEFSVVINNFLKKF